MCRTRPSRERFDGGTARLASWSASSPAHLRSKVARCQSSQSRSSISRSGSLRRAGYSSERSTSGAIQATAAADASRRHERGDGQIPHPGHPHASSDGLRQAPVRRTTKPSPDRLLGSTIVDEEFLLFAGSGSRRLAAEIGAYLGCPLGRSEVLRFSEGNLFVRVLENVRGRDVFLIQGTAFPANDNFMELLFWIDAFKRASAASVTAVIPYFSYAKGDKKDEPRVSIRARVCADAIEAAGADRVVTIDLHAPQVQGFFKVPVDDLYAMPVLCDAIAAKGLDDVVVVSPGRRVRKEGPTVGTPARAPTRDRRQAASGSHRDSRGRRAHRIGDGQDSAGRGRLHHLRRHARHAARGAGGAGRQGGVCGGYPLACSPQSAIERLDGSPIERLFVTNSVETQPVELPPQVEVVSVAGLFGEAIRRIAQRESISVLFT